MERTIGNYTYYTDGRIYSHKKKMFLTGCNINGYNVVGINGRNIRRNRAIAQVFIPNPNNLPEVNHIDENKLNNRAENLEWCTHKYNMNHGTRSERSRMKRRNNKSQSKPVFQYAMDGSFIKEWPSAMEVERVLKLNSRNIGKCCLGKRNKCGGFIWSFRKPLTSL